MEIFTDINESRTKHAKRVRILLSAYDLFLEHGIERVSMQDIATKCGIQRRSLYNYYSKKEEIAFDLMKCWYASSKTGLQLNHSESMSSFERIRQMSLDFYSWLKQNPDMVRFSVHFDHYFQANYDDTVFENYIRQFFLWYQDEILPAAIVCDGSIKPIYEGRVDELIRTILTALIAFAQRVMYREDILKRTTSVSIESMDTMLELLLASIRND